MKYPTPGLKMGDAVHGIVDWARRFVHMRSHTASHILSSVVHEDCGAHITGNQLGLDKSRVDFDLENFDRERIKIWETKTNEL